MQTRQTRGLQAFRRVEAWFVEHPNVIPASGSSATALTSQVAALQTVVDRMTVQATEQTTQASQATLAAKDEQTLRSDVRSLHVKAIVKVAGALRGKVPGMGVFKSPRPGLRSEALIHAAEAIQTTAGVYKDVFVEHGLPADFLDQLQTATAALKSSVDARGVALSKRTGASTGLVSDLALGRQILAMIDASLAHALKSDPATLASWHQARRLTVKGAVARNGGTVVPGVASVAPVTHGVLSVPSGVVPVAPVVVSADGGVVSPAVGVGSVSVAQDDKAA